MPFAIPNQYRLHVVVSLLLLLLVAGYTGPAAAASESQTILVRLQPAADIEQISLDYQAQVVRHISRLGVFELEVAQHTQIDQLRADARVATVQVAQRIDGQPRWIGVGGDSLDAQPRWIGVGGQSSNIHPDWTDETIDGQPRWIGVGGTAGAEFAEQWAVEQLRLTRAYPLSTGAGVTVAILDTGVDSDHPLLIERLVPGYDFVDNDDDPEDILDGIDDDLDWEIDEGAGHGSHVAGIVALVAPEAKLMPVRIFNTDGVGRYADLIAGIVYAVDQGADVINLSGSGAEPSPFLEEAINYAWDRGVIVVAAGGVNNLGYPATYAPVISVGAMDENDYLTDFGRFGASASLEPDVYAPGTNIFSAYHDGSYASWTGHSMATPFVAGEVALLRTAAACDRDCVVETLSATAHRIQRGGATFNRIDVFDGIAEVLASPTIEIQGQLAQGAPENPVEMRLFFALNNGGNSIDLEDLTIRYWGQEDHDSPGNYVVTCDYAAVGCGSMTSRVVNVEDQPQTDYFIETGFNAGAGILWGGTDSGEIQLRLHTTDWRLLDASNDYSYTAAEALSEAPQITVYYQQQLIWGEEPVTAAGGASPPPAADPSPGSTPAEPTENPAPPADSPTVSIVYAPNDELTGDAHIRPQIKIVNNGSENAQLEDIVVRYYFSDEAGGTPVVNCDYTTFGCGNLLMSATDGYIEYSFTSAAGVIPAGDDVKVYGRIHSSNWSAYDELNDYSFGSSVTDFKVWERITVYHDGYLIWGIEPPVTP